MKEKWVIDRTQADFGRLAAKFNLPPLIIKLIVNRGIKEEDIEEYLYGTINSLSDAHKMKDIDKASDILKKASDKGDSIAVVTDYDCDGIFAGMILYTGLKKAGAKPELFTPDRVKEGYGINRRIIDEAYGKGISLLITCDNGIAAAEEVKYAKKLGMTVIITDHHEVPFLTCDNDKRNYIIPPADAVCNPKQADCGYSFKGLCGAGVCYRLMGILYEMCGISEDEMNILLQYAAIATVADVMELSGENRIIVREGLKLLSHTDNPGLWAIKEVNEINERDITPYHVGFIIGPCFNAAGRLGTVKPAFDLLTSDNKKEAYDIALTLKSLNDYRKEMTEKGACIAAGIAESPRYRDKDVLVIYIKDCHESIAGIVAGRIKEKYNKPVIIFAEAEDGIYKGSGRSIPAYNMYDELAKCRNLFCRFGGHAMAAGMSLPKENFDMLEKILNENSPLTEEDFVSVVDIDAEVNLRHVSIPVIESFSVLMPFGEGNREPLFFGRRFSIVRARIIGKNSNVLKMTIADSEKTSCNAMMFDNMDNFLNDVERIYGTEQMEMMLRGAANDVCAAFTFNARINEYNGFRNVQLIIKNYKIIPDSKKL